MNHPTSVPEDILSDYWRLDVIDDVTRSSFLYQNLFNFCYHCVSPEIQNIVVDESLVMQELRNVLCYPIAERSLADEAIVAAAMRFGLNMSQVSTLHSSVQERICLIHGPPGSGKTQTGTALVAVYRQLDHETCVVAASHNAVDELGVHLL